MRGGWPPCLHLGFLSTPVSSVFRVSQNTPKQRWHGRAAASRATLGVHSDVDVVVSRSLTPRGPAAADALQPSGPQSVDSVPPHVGSVPDSAPAAPASGRFAGGRSFAAPRSEERGPRGAGCRPRFGPCRGRLVGSVPAG